jgi:hypothetical protein
VAGNAAVVQERGLEVEPMPDQGDRIADRDQEHAAARERLGDGQLADADAGLVPSGLRRRGERRETETGDHERSLHRRQPTGDWGSNEDAPGNRSTCVRFLVGCGPPPPSNRENRSWPTSCSHTGPPPQARGRRRFEEYHLNTHVPRAAAVPNLTEIVATRTAVSLTVEMGETEKGTPTAN